MFFPRWAQMMFVFNGLIGASNLFLQEECSLAMSVRL